MIIEKNILIISAHADDHIVCAGTVFKLLDRGYQAYEVVLTDSSLGQNNRVPEQIDADTVRKIRAKELSVASKFLGISKTFQLNEGDLSLSYSQKIMFEVVKIIRKVKPEIVFLMSADDMHPDHQVANKIGLNACKIAATGVLKESLGKQHRAKLLLCSDGMIPQKSQLLVDVTDYANKKAKLFSLYTTQASQNILNYDAALGIVRGYQLRNGGNIAEAFSLADGFPSVLFESI